MKRVLRWTRSSTPRARRAELHASPRPVTRARLVLIGNTLLVGPTETAAAARPRKRSAPESTVPDTPPSEVPNDEEVIGAIILASRVMVAIAVRSLVGNPDDVTLPQYRTLVELTFGGPRRLADLAEALSVSPSTATRMCDRLVRKELVSRTRDELDRREVKLAITSLGRTVVSDVIERRRAEVRDLLQAIPVPLRRQLVSSLTLLATAAGEAPELHWGPGWY
jgi:DNA-binding MarR family transcriptional regulator